MWCIVFTLNSRILASFIQPLHRTSFSIRTGHVTFKAMPSSRIRLMLSSEVPGVGMISPSMPRRDRNPDCPGS